MTGAITVISISCMLGKHLEVTVCGRTLGRLGALWGSRSPVLPYKFSRNHQASSVHHCVLFTNFTNERVSHLLEQSTTLPFAFSKKRLSLFIWTQEPGQPSSHSSKIAHGRPLWEQGEFERTWALWAAVQGSFIRTATSTVTWETLPHTGMQYPITSIPRWT